MNREEEKELLDLTNKRQLKRRSFKETIEFKNNKILNLNYNRDSFCFSFEVTIKELETTIFISKILRSTLIRVSIERSELFRVNLELVRRRNRKNLAILKSFRNILTRLDLELGKLFIQDIEIVSLHFPIICKIEDQIITIENFLGSRAKIVIKIISNVWCSLDRDILTIKSYIKEQVSCFANILEERTKKYCKKLDRRKFPGGFFRKNAIY